MQVKRLAEMVSERSGRRVAKLVRIKRGSQSVNFAGTREDGSRFALKLVPFRREKQYARLVEHLEKIGSPVVVSETLPRVRFDFEGHHVLSLEWCEGEIVPFDRLFDAISPESFLEGYRKFSESVQRVSLLYPSDATGLKELDSGRIVIHGDWQADNLRFSEGRLVHVLDVEELRLGRPVEDFVRYASCSFGHLPFFALARRSRIIGNLARLAEASGFPPGEWVAALRASMAERLRKRRRFGVGRWMRFYGELERGISGR